MTAPNTPRRARWIWIPLALAAAVAIGFAARSAATPTAVAMVNPNTVLEGLTEQKARQAAIQAIITQRTAERDDLIRQATVLRDDLVSATGADVVNIQLQILEIEARISARQQFFEATLPRQTATILAELYGKIEDAVARYAQQQGYDIVLVDDRALTFPRIPPDPNGVLRMPNAIFAADTTDITSAVTAMMNNEYSAGSAAP